MAGTGSRKLRHAKPSGPGLLVQRVMPAFPATEEAEGVLRANLAAMGCAELLDRPWGWTDDTFVRELLSPDNRWDLTVRARPAKWGVEEWRATYDFREGEVTVAERRDELLAGEFVRTANPKEGYSVDDLKDPEARMVIGFLNPIFHPEKPRRLVSKWAATFLGAFRGKFRVDWAALMNEMVDRKVRDLRKSKKSGTPLPSYLAHLYSTYELLQSEEEKMYEEILDIQKYGGAVPEEEGGSDREEARTPPPSPPVRKTKKRNRSLITGPEETSDEGQPEGPPEEARPEEQRDPASGEALPLTGAGIDRFLANMQTAGTQAEQLARWARSLLEVQTEVLGESGVADVGRTMDRIRELKCTEIRLENQEQEHQQLLQTVEELRMELQVSNQLLTDARRESATAQARLVETVRTVAEVKADLEVPVEVASQAAMFREWLHRNETPDRVHIIRYLVDRHRKMEKTCDQLRELVAQIPPMVQPEAPRQPDPETFRTPRPVGKGKEQAGTSGTPPDWKGLEGLEVPDVQMMDSPVSFGKLLPGQTPDSRTAGGSAQSTPPGGQMDTSPVQSIRRKMTPTDSRSGQTGSPSSARQVMMSGSPTEVRREAAPVNETPPTGRVTRRSPRNLGSGTKER